jgi:alpha/beta hydrolase family protein
VRSLAARRPGAARAFAIAVSLLGLAGCGQSAAPEAAAAPPPLCQAAAGANPTVVGPIASVAPGDPSHDYPWGATQADLSGHDYVEEEYFFCGLAPVGTYTTRMIVRRPAAAAAFNGAVLVEWLNVTSDYDWDLLWQRSYEHIMKAGYAYVGVSAQRVGIYATPNGLKAWSPQRYAQLSIPQGASLDSTFIADPASYSIYTQALRALKSPQGLSPLGGLAAKWVIASGGSQSGGTIVVYYDAFQALERVADGFLPFIISQSSLNAAVGSDLQTNVEYPVISEVVRTPYFLVNSETDPSFVRQPDSNYFRLWEVAGATHEDQDLMDVQRPLILRDLGIDLQATDKSCADPPRSRIPFRYAMNAAMDHLLAWLQSGALPPSGPPFQYDAAGDLVRDSYGNVLGGIRLPQQVVPTAVNRRDNPGTCMLEGQHVPFSDDLLRSLYPSHAAYVTGVTHVAQADVAAGYLLPDDAAETLSAAQGAAVPP